MGTLYSLDDSFKGKMRGGKLVGVRSEHNKGKGFVVSGKGTNIGDGENPSFSQHTNRGDTARKGDEKPLERDRGGNETP